MSIFRLGSSSSLRSEPALGGNCPQDEVTVRKFFLKGGERVKCPVWFGGCRFGGSRSVDCPYSPCSAVVAKCERESHHRRLLFDLRKKEKGETINTKGGTKCS